MRTIGVGRGAAAPDGKGQEKGDRGGGVALREHGHRCNHSKTRAELALALVPSDFGSFGEPVRQVVPHRALVSCKEVPLAWWRTFAVSTCNP
jgi:hypothetical protein